MRPEKRRHDLEEALQRVDAQRISTGETPAGARRESVCVPREDRLTIDVERIDSYTLLCTPGDGLALAAGFLLSEGIIDGMQDVASLEPCKDDASLVRVRLTRERPAIGDTGRNLLIVSSCGACGDEALDAKIASLPRVGDRLRLAAEQLSRVAAELRRRQPLFEQCGGTHAAAVFDSEGAILASAEDTGRHNALDKAIGRRLLAGEGCAGQAVFLSGRVSLEMVGKCARAGLELIAAVSAPTSLAVEVAERCGITLCAFVRETRATVFTHARRIVDSG
jgi:FdhD protein